MTATENETEGFWRELWASIRGVRRSYTSGSIARAVVLLSVPMVLEMVMQSVFSVVDVYFIAKLGPAAVAAAGMTDSMLTLVFAVAMGLSMAATATVARRIGENEPELAALSAVQAITLGALISVPITVIGIAFAPNLLAAMGASEEIVEAGGGFTAIMLGTNITVVLLFLINAIFRGAGDASTAMRVLWTANLLNIVLDPILMFGWGPIPAMGIEGAAIATSSSRAIGILIQLHALSRGRGQLAIRRAHLRVEPEIAARMLRLARVGMLQFIVGTASWVAIFRILATFGGTAVAGYTIAVRVVIFALLPSWGMGNAAATLVGQNLGARQPDRAERSVWISAFSNVLFLSAVGLVFHFYAERLALIFTQDPGVVAVAASCLAIVAYGYPAFGFGMVIVQAFNGAGDTATPTWINLFCYWVLQIPLAYTLSTLLGMGPDGVFVTIAVSQSAIALVGIAAFRRGTWKARAV